LKIAITGHTGFIGSHLVRFLRTKEVVGISRSALDEFSGEQIKLDLANVEETTFDQYAKTLSGSEVLVHLAGYRPIVRSSKQNSLEENLTVNVRGTLAVLKAAKRFGIKKFVFSSTKAVYGKRKGLQTEEDLTLPDTNYGRSKLLAERLCRRFAWQYGLSCISLRFSSVFGPGMPCNLVFADFLNNAIRGEPLVVHEHLSGFEPLDLVYVKDAVSAIEGSIRWDPESPFEVINISKEPPVNSLQLAEEIVRTSGSRSKIVIRKTQDRRVPNLLSAKKASRCLGWVAKYGIADAIKDSIDDWHCHGIS